MAKRRVVLQTLAGQPTDGSGRTSIHLFVRDANGPLMDTHVLHPVHDADGNIIPQRLEAKPTRGRLACNTHKGKDIVLIHTDDPRAVTCTRCQASSDYRKTLDLLEASST